MNMQYSTRRYLMNTVADPIKNDVLAVLLGYPKGEVGSSSALWVAEQVCLTLVFPFLLFYHYIPQLPPFSSWTFWAEDGCWSGRCGRGVTPTRRR